MARLANWVRKYSKTRPKMSLWRWVERRASLGPVVSSCRAMLGAPVRWMEPMRSMSSLRRWWSFAPRKSRQVAAWSRLVLTRAAVSARKSGWRSRRKVSACSGPKSAPMPMGFPAGDWNGDACLKPTGGTLPDGTGGFKRAVRGGRDRKWRKGVAPYCLHQCRKVGGAGQRRCAENPDRAAVESGNCGEAQVDCRSVAQGDMDACRKPAL